MSISEMLKIAADPKIRSKITVALIIGYYCLFKIMLLATKRKKICDPTEEYKLILAIRTDLNMGEGKVVTQCVNAAITAYKSAKKQPVVLKAWSDCGQPKIIVRLDSNEALREVGKRAKSLGLLVTVVRDTEKTQDKPGNRTVCAIGPGPASLIDNVTGALELY